MIAAASRLGGMGRPRNQPDLSDPRGQLGAYLRAWIDRHHAGDEDRLAKVLGVTPRAVRKWCEGASAPDLVKLDSLAKEMGFADWMKLAAAVSRHVA